MERIRKIVFGIAVALCLSIVLTINFKHNAFAASGFCYIGDPCGAIYDDGSWEVLGFCWTDVSTFSGCGCSGSGIEGLGQYVCSMM